MINDIFKGVSLFVEGQGYIAELESVNLPEVEVRTEDFDAGTMSTKSIDMLGVEPMNLSFKTSNINPAILSLLGKPNTSFEIRGYIEGEDGSSKTFVANARGSLKKGSLGELKSFSKSSSEYESNNLHYYKLVIDKQTIYEIDVDNNIRNINGNDYLTEFRRALGI